MNDINEWNEMRRERQGENRQKHRVKMIYFKWYDSNIYPNQSFDFIWDCLKFCCNLSLLIIIIIIIIIYTSSNILY